MKLGRQTRIAFAQLLLSLPTDYRAGLMYKHLGIDPGWLPADLKGLGDALEQAEGNELSGLVLEFFVNQASARAYVTPKYVFDEAHGDFQRWLLHDGWSHQDGKLTQLGPGAGDAVEIRDELIEALAGTSLDSDGEIRKLIAQSATAFSAAPPDYNASGTNARIALETLVRRLAVGGSGRVIGVDPSTSMLDEARSGAERSGLGDVFDYHQGTIDRLPLPDASVDWIWCKDAFWPAPGVVDDPPAALGQLCRVVRPGGTIALLYWTSQSVLTGYPVLEALLGARVAETLPYLAGVPAERHFLRAAGWMRQAGLVDVRTRALSAGHQGPMDSTTQEAMGCLFDMFYGGMESSISGEDWALLRTLTDPESPDYLPRREDYYCVLNYTLFMGLAVV